MIITLARKLIRITLNSWPPHRDLLQLLKQMKKNRVGVQELRVLFPDIGVSHLKVTVPAIFERHDMTLLMT